MARPSKFTPQKKQQIVLAVMRGELSIAEAARRFAASEGSIAMWRDLFVEGGVAALEDAHAAVEGLLGFPLIEGLTDPQTGQVVPVILVTDNEPCYAPPGSRAIASRDEFTTSAPATARLRPTA